jgi:hypothetical protein
MLANVAELTVANDVFIWKPAHRVFVAFADPAVQALYDPMLSSVEKLTAGPIAKGSCFRAQFEHAGTVEFEFTEFEQDQLVEQSAQMPFGPMRHRIELEARPDGTRLRQTITLEPNIRGLAMWPVLLQQALSDRLRRLNELVKGNVELVD